MITKKIGEFSAQLKYSELPDEIILAAKQRLLDFLESA
jgi:2-methylcitrate dehydratase PrpD